MKKSWFIENNKEYQGLWITDFDGTIKPPQGPVSSLDKSALRALGRLGVARVVATGRSLFAFCKEWDGELKFDFLIFSSGLGLCSWGPLGPGPLLVRHVFNEEEIRQVIGAAEHLGYGYFAFLPPPDNHHFFYRRPVKAPLGFEMRLKIYAAQNKQWPYENSNLPANLSLGQVLIMVPQEEMDAAENKFRRLAPDFSLVRSTSPFGDNCFWLEVYPQGVSKGQAADRLAQMLNLGPEKALAFGNDYNDRDLLHWAGRSFVAADAPADLLALYPAIPKAGEGGLAAVLEKFGAFGHDQ